MVDIDVLLEVLDEARQYEGYIASLCPFHSDDRPSFMVWPDYYRCYACGASGRTEDLFHLVRGVVVHKLKPVPIRNPWRGWIKRYGRIGLAMKVAHSNLPSEYLSRRGIEEVDQVRLRLGFLDDWYTFPFYDADGKIIGGIARRGEGNQTPAKYLTPPGQNNRQTIYVPDWGLLHQSREVIVTFGILDAITLAINGIAAISIIGLFVDPNVFDFIRKNILIVPDFREEKWALALSSRLDWRGHAIKVTYPDGCKDLNEVYCNCPSLFESVITEIRTSWQSHGRALPK